MKRRTFFGAIAAMFCLPWRKQERMRYRATWCEVKIITGDGDFIGTRRFTINEIARVYNVPQELIRESNVRVESL